MATREHAKSTFKVGSRLWLLLILIPILLMLLTSCGRAYTVDAPVVMPLDETNAMGLIQYLENLEEGPMYTYSLDVPADWVGNFALRNEGNRLVFDYVSDEEALPAPVFSIMALSPNQYWDQVGGYPGQYGDVVVTGDTYFIYQLPVDAYHSGLPKDLYVSLAEQVPSVVSSFQVEAVP